MAENTNNQELEKEQQKESNPYKNAMKKNKKKPGGNPAPQNEPVEVEEAPQAEVVPEVTIEVPQKELPQPVQTVEPVVEALSISQELQTLYNSPTYSRFGNERLHEKITLLIKPSMKKRLTKDKQLKRIKSPNDLINFLLDQYYGVE